MRNGCPRKKVGASTYQSKIRSTETTRSPLAASAQQAAMPVVGFLSARTKTKRGFDRLPWRRWISISPASFPARADVFDYIERFYNPKRRRQGGTSSRPRPHRRCWPARPDLGEPSRLVATASSTRRLNLLSVTKRAVVPRSARFCFRPPNGQIAAPLRLSKKRQWFPKNCNRVFANNEVRIFSARQTGHIPHPPKSSMSCVLAFMLHRRVSTLLF
jgi:hypothetical protein